MSPDICILFTLTDGDSLLRAVVKIDVNKLPEGPETVQYFREPKNYEFLASILPLHVKSFGKIVRVEEIFEVTVIS